MRMTPHENRNIMNMQSPFETCSQYHCTLRLKRAFYNNMLVQTLFLFRIIVIQTCNIINFAVSDRPLDIQIFESTII